MSRAYLAVLFSVLVLNLVDSQFSQFSDYTDITFANPLSYLWNNKENLIQESYETCTVSNLGDSLSGMCKNPFDCTFSRGRSVGRGTCGYLRTCCIFEKTCNATTDARVSYFKAPVNVRENNELCRFVVKLANENVCQIRIDFLQMSITNPVEVPATTPDTGSRYKCTIDRFYVEPAQKDIPEICGVNNADSHIYMHLDNSAITKAVTLNMALASTITAGIVEQNPTWNIKVTQLECPGKQKKFNSHKKYSSPNQAAEDFSLLAPDGCLQYYTKATGVITSFGYSTQKATCSYTTKQDYGICFKKDNNFCGISLTNGDIRFRENTGTCKTKHFLFVPEGMPSDKICQVDKGTPVPDDVSSNHPGPLYLHMHADDTAPISTPNDEGFGFSYNYNTKATTCT